MQTDRFLKHVPFAKVDEAKQEAWGIFTAEVQDSDDEMADFDSQSEEVKSWAEESRAKTTKAGQEPSLGNVRIQHTDKPVGKVIGISEDGVAKTISGGTYIADPMTWDLIKKGILTGFSFGGRYVKRWCSDCDADMPLMCGENYCPKCHKNVVVKFRAKISELSVVDRPACPIADILHIKSDGSQLVHKAHKWLEVEMAKEAKTKRVADVDLTHDCFAYVGDVNDTSTWKLPIKFPGDDEKTKSHIRNALARFGQTQGIPDDEKAKVKAKIVAAAHAHGIDVSEEEEKSDKPSLAKSFILAEKAHIKAHIEKTASDAGITLRKGLWEVANFAEALQQIAWLRYAALNERDYEGDDSKVPDQLTENLEDLAQTFLAMAEEEVSELIATAKAEKVKVMADKNEKNDGVTPEVHDALIGHAAETAAHHEVLADHHKAMKEHHEQHHAMHKAAHDHFKAAEAEGGEHSEHHAVHTAVAAANMAHHAAKAEHHEKMHKAHAEHAEKCSKLCETVGGAEKSAKALKVARDAKPAKVSKSDSNGVALAPGAKLPADASPEMVKAFEKAQTAWFNSEEYQTIMRESLKAQTIRTLNLSSSEQAALLPGFSDLSKAAGASDLSKFRSVARGESTATTEGVDMATADLVGY